MINWIRISIWRAVADDDDESMNVLKRRKEKLDVRDGDDDDGACAGRSEVVKQEMQKYPYRLYFRDLLCRCLFP